MNDLEKKLLFYINNYHFNKSKIIYIHLILHQEFLDNYEVTIYGPEYEYNKSIIMSKNYIRNKKINNLIS